METKVKITRGGVFISHGVENGKHSYKVKKVLLHKGDCKETLLRKGDQLLKIDDTDLQDLPPECFADLLAKSTPVLTVHQCHIENLGQKPAGSGIRPCSKEETFLCFNLELKRESELKEERSDETMCPTPEESRRVLDNLLLVTLTGARLSVIKARGSSGVARCQNAQCKDGKLNDVVVVAKDRKIAKVPNEISNFLQDKSYENIFIQSLLYDKYIQKRSKHARLSSNGMTTSAKMTVYYYKFDSMGGDFKGQPVVLNFSGTDCFLKCCYIGDKPCLSVEDYDKCRLKFIVNGDKDALSFVFYMVQFQCQTRHFQSASCPGWYLYAKEQQIEIEQIVKEDEAFYFLFQKGDY